MTTKQIADLLDPKNQMLPALKLESSFKKASRIFVPVIQGEEASLKKQFTFAKNEKLSGKCGERVQKIHGEQIYYFVGVGAKKGINARRMRRFYGGVYLAALGSKPESIGLAVGLEWLKVAATGVHVAALNPKNLHKKPNKKAPNPDVIFINKHFKAKAAQAKKELKMGQVLAEGKNLMRILGSLPPNTLHQKSYAELCLMMAKKWKVKCQRVAKSKLKSYELLNAVSSGSEFDSELIIFTLNPKKKSKSATAVVGKGLCYDSGGLIGKQNHMKSMKEDMAGSAAVLGTVLAIAKGGLTVSETTYMLMPLAQNMMGQSAMRADDVYRTGDGQTVEIIHTDAEGRLVMADAICYAKKNFKSIKRYYTIATLTGSCVGALGDIYTGVVCNDEKLAKATTKTGKETGDYVHVAPWDLEYDDNNSPVADVANLGENARDAGWIKAGLFLYRFVPKDKNGEPEAEFCHFDIAGSIDMDERGKAWRRKGFNSGVGISLLSELLTN